MEIAGILLLVLALIYIISLLSNPKLPVIVNKEVKEKVCPPHKWRYHELDGHMFCEVCKKLPLQEDNGERV